MGVHTSPLHTLQFVVFKNVAKIYQAKGEYDDALTYYMKAVNVDDGDEESWAQIGQISFELKKYKTAIWAFNAGKEVSENSFVFLDGLIKTTYEVGLFNECYVLINQALRDNPCYNLGLAIKDTILALHVDGLSMTSMLESCIDLKDVFAFQVKIDKGNEVPRDLAIHGNNLKCKVRPGINSSASKKVRN